MTSTMAAPPERGGAADDEPPGRFDGSRPLDREVAAGLGRDVPWRSSAVLAVVAVPVISLGLPLLVWGAGLPRHGDAPAAYSLVGELLLGLVVLLAARRVAQACGGWSAALGLTRPARDDGSTVAAWSGIQLGVKFALGVVLAVLIPWMRHHHGGNLPGTQHLGVGGIAILVVAAVLVAPVVEEIAFRGLLLRAIMRRTGFWPAALASSAVFGALHAPTASAVPVIPAVVIWTTVFAVLQCVLVRSSARLAPAMGVHAVANLLTIVLALALTG